MLVIEANPDHAGLMHTPQSVLRVIDKLSLGEVVIILAALPSTYATYLTRPVTHVLCQNVHTRM